MTNSETEQQRPLEAAMYSMDQKGVVQVLNQLAQRLMLGAKPGLTMSLTYKNAEWPAVNNSTTGLALHHVELLFSDGSGVRVTTASNKDVLSVNALRPGNGWDNAWPIEEDFDYRYDQFLLHRGQTIAMAGVSEQIEYALELVQGSRGK